MGEFWGNRIFIKLVVSKEYISECGAFSLNNQSVSFLQAHLLLELIGSSLLTETGGKCPLVFSVNRVIKGSENFHTFGPVSFGVLQLNSHLAPSPIQKHDLKIHMNFFNMIFQVIVRMYCCKRTNFAAIWSLLF